MITLIAFILILFIACTRPWDWDSDGLWYNVSGAITFLLTLIFLVGLCKWVPIFFRWLIHGRSLMELL